MVIYYIKLTKTSWTYSRILTILNSSKTVRTNRHHEVGIEVVLKSCLWFVPEKILITERDKQEVHL